MAKRGRPRGGTPYRLEQRGRIWYAVYYDANARRQRRRSTGTECRKEAEEQCARWWAEKHRPIQASPDDVLIAEALAIYLDHMTGRPSATQASIAAEKYIGPAFAALPISGLMPSHQEEFISSLRENGLSEGYISRILSVLRAALNHAYKYRVVLAVPHIFDVKREHVRERWLSRDEARLLLRHARDPMLNLFVRISLATGARPSAVTSLTWGQIDTINGRIDFRVTGEVETNKRRTVSRITDGGLLELLDHARAASRFDGLGYVFVRKDGAWVRSYKQQVKRLARRCGLNDVTQYTFRHTYGAWQVQAGVPLFNVAKAMGHRDTRMIEKHYGHLSPDYQDECAAVAANEFRAIFAQNGKSGDYDPNKPLETLVGTVRIERTTPTMSTSKSAPNVIKLQDVRRHKKQEHDKN